MKPDFQMKTICLLLVLPCQTVFADTGHQEVEHVDMDTVKVSGKRQAQRNTERSQSYTIGTMATATGLRISGKDTPQSVSVMTRRQLDDKAIYSLEDAMKNTTGINVVRDSGLQTRFLSRGFYVDQIGEDGITTNVSGRSGYTAKIDVSPSTDLAVYDHIEVVRGATGLTQSNSEPGGTINLIRKRPTALFKHTGEISTDHRGSKRLALDVSGSLNNEHTVRGRLVGVHEDHRSFKEGVWNKKDMVYGVIDTDLSDNSMLTLGGTYQKNKDIPDFAGVILPCEDQKTAAFSSSPACNNPLKLPRNTYLGESSWSRLNADKYNIFSGFKHVFDNGWQLNAEISYTRNDSDAKVGQFFLKNEHAAGISASEATGFLTEKGEVIPFEPKDKALAKLKEYRDGVTKTYEEKKADYIAHRFDASAFEQYRSQRAAARRAGFDQCMQDIGLDFLCNDWQDPGVEVDKKEFVDKELAKQGIINNAEGLFPNRLYDSAYNLRHTYNRRYNFMPLHYTKHDVQWGFKLDLTGNYRLLGREHDFFIGYAYNNEKIRSAYTEIYQNRYFVRPQGYAGAGSCGIHPDGPERNPLEKGIVEPDWHIYNEKGNNKIYVPECSGAHITKYTPRLDAEGKPVWTVNDNGERVMVQDPVYELDANGNKIQERDEEGNLKWANQYLKIPLWKTVQVADDHVPALYNYSKYLNTNKTHSLTVSTRFNATNRLHLLGGMHYTRYETTQAKEMPVRYGQPATAFQTESSNKIDKEHYTSKMQSHRFTPYAGITYDLTPQQSLYASYTKIFKQQDNVDVTSKSVLPPLIGTNYEIGWKGSFLQGRLNASLALFVLQQKNRTVVDFGFVPDTGRNGGSFQTIAKPVGKVKSSGAELELAGELSENWRIFVGYTYNKSKYKNAAEVNAERLEKNTTADPYNFSNFTPVHMFRLGTSYRLPQTKLTLGGGISAQSRTSSLYNIRQGGYGLIDGFVQYDFHKHGRISLIGTNLADRTYFENNYNRTRGQNNFYGEPRTVKLKLDWHF